MYQNIQLLSKVEDLPPPLYILQYYCSHLSLFHYFSIFIENFIKKSKKSCFFEKNTLSQKFNMYKNRVSFSQNSIKSLIFDHLLYHFSSKNEKLDPIFTPHTLILQCFFQLFHTFCNWKFNQKIIDFSSKNHPPNGWLKILPAPFLTLKIPTHLNYTSKITYPKIYNAKPYPPWPHFRVQNHPLRPKITPLRPKIRPPPPIFIQKPTPTLLIYNFK